MKPKIKKPVKPVKEKKTAPNENKSVDGLNYAQQRFCEEYVFDWNGTRAYQVAYPKASYDTAREGASVNLTKPNILTYIELLKDRVTEMAGVSKLKVLQEVCKMAFSNIANLHNDWIELSEFDKLTPEQKACIETIETKTEQRVLGETALPIDVKYVKISLYNKPKCLEIINKMCGYNEPEQKNVKLDMGKQDIATKFDQLFTSNDTVPES
jgi:phage terminase small subunit